MSMLSELVQARLEEVDQRLSILEKSLRGAPEGRLRISTHGKRTQCYQITEHGDHTGRYMRRSEAEMIRRLAQKDHDRRAQKMLLQEKKLLEKLDRYYDHSIKRIRGKRKKEMPEFYSGPEELLLSRSIAARKELIMPVAVDNETFVGEWLSEPYEKKDFSILMWNIIREAAYECGQRQS